MFIIYDSDGYQYLGRLLVSDGWVEYIRLGPAREPFYPFLISIAMKIANYFSISYLPIQITIQLLFLLISQILTLKLLKKLNINSTLCVLTILYIGFSPAIINSAIILWSEIAVYPFVLSIILISSTAWQKIQSYNNKGKKKQYLQTVFLAALLGISFVLSTFVKTIFELIVCVFFPIYFVLIIKSLVKRRKVQAINFTIFLICFFIISLVPINLFKYANKKLNGTFALRNTGPWALYGNTERRLKKLTSEKFFSAVAYAVNPNVCSLLPNPSSCAYWHYTTSDIIGRNKSSELKKSGMTNNEIDKTLLKLSLDQMREKPFQSILLIGVESIKMIFWEKPKLGFAVYPSWIEKIFKNKIFNVTLIASMALLTFFAVLYLFIHLWRQRKQIFLINEVNTELIILTNIFFLIVPFITLHSFFFILPRYALPISFLYLILIAYFIQQVFFNNIKKLSA